ncbi:GNAT family N-acetyltransferase [Aurantibacter crassamenti]|uniref:GNAT family N-acetyltransferase n=1 Tax=Aurantibacter crassamenti TaxID=1837375 RepID=UPI00193A4EA4|nr:GNAT family N-acetyltransferase [Aurantibacter crassamenti]MBM1106753.1 GNAT family N-acetyltransferase [Aurantibacter crassamenti]
MSIVDNPFLSDTFSSVFLRHFNESEAGIKFDFIEHLRFTKNNTSIVLKNVGATFTKGINYSLSNKKADDYKGKVFLIYDVPTYFNSVSNTSDENLGFYASKQYPGFLINLETFKDLSQYMATTFSKSSRYKLNKYKKRFEQCFDIEYRMYYGDISKSEYDAIFKSFESLLRKRFDDKEVENNNLRPEEWNFYYEVVYPMILENKASLFVIYDSGKPIGVTLNYFSDSVLFDAITVFDIDYSKFHLGSITIMKLIEWSIENNLKVFDFSKGYFDYKTRWSNKIYDFEYHIYYDKKSYKARITAFYLKKFYDFKQYLRDKKLNEKIHKVTYRLKRNRSAKTTIPRYAFLEVDPKIQFEEQNLVDNKSLDQSLLKQIVFEFLYLNNECMTNIKVYEIKNGEINYLLQGLSKSTGVAITS